MPNAARMTDKVLHDNPHCHAGHPDPVPHPPAPHQLLINTAPTVMINNLPAATVMTMTEPCSHIGCVPNGPGIVMKGSATVVICMQPSARMGDMVQHAACVAPIPSPTGKIIPPCSTNVVVGG
jgi:uncharacterized Zn-binding protein involved in type VI secretion